MEEKKELWCVYCHTNKTNNKKYIGITSYKPEHRWGKEGNGYKNQFFYDAIKKYGWDNFEHEILFDNLIKEQAEEKEIELISKYNTLIGKMGYNYETGGLKKRNTSTYCNERKNLENNGYVRNNRENFGKRSRKVICLNDGLIFESAEYAKKYYYDFNLSSDKIRKVCNMTENSHGVDSHGDRMVWRYYKEGEVYKYAYENKHLRKVKQMDLNRNIISTYNSIAEASVATGISRTFIGMVCNNKKQKTAKGYIFEYCV